MQMSDHYPALEGNLAAFSLGYEPKHRQQNQAQPQQQPILPTEDLGLPDSWVRKHHLQAPILNSKKL